MKLKLRVGQLMRERNMSERELSERTGLARNTVRAIMRGVNTRVDLEVLNKISEALGVHPAELFEYEIPLGNKKPVGAHP
jgi:DNA-binding Xre family transcriptional regulator